jgi:hypothetical protein
MGDKILKKGVNRVFLSEIELQTIAENEFASKRIEQVRDIFLFYCYTGFAYADIYKLKRSEIYLSIDGKKWISTSREKNRMHSRMPLLPLCLSILDNYGDDVECIAADRLLPVLSNQKMYSYLKEIADLCGITKELTFHIGRYI